MASNVKCDRVFICSFVLLIVLGIRSIPGGSHDILLPLGTVVVL